MLTFSNDGELLGVADTYEDATLLWKLRTGETRWVLKGQQIQLFQVSFLPGIRLVAVSDDGTQMWDAETEQRIYALAETYDFRSHASHAGPWEGMTTSFSFSSDGSRSAMGIGVGIVAVREWETSRTLLWQTQSRRVDPETLKFPFYRLQTVALSSDGHTLATGGCDHLVRLWDARTGELLHTLGRRVIVLQALAFAPDGKSLTVLSDDGIARVWSLEEARLLSQEIHGMGPPPPWGEAPIWKTAAKLWNSDRSTFFTDGDIPQDAEIIAISPDGSLMLLKQQDEHLSVWNRSTRSLVTTLPNTASNVNAEFSSDNRFLALNSNYRQLRLFDLKDNGSFQDLAQDALLFAFSPDGRTLVVDHDQREELGVWDVRTARKKRALRSPQHGPEGISVLALSPDSKMLALAPSYDEEVWLQPLGRTRKGILLSGHKANVHTITFSLDGTRLATGGADGTIMLWDIATATLLATLLALPDGEWAIYTQEGRYAASPGADTYLRWRVGSDLLPAETYAQEWKTLQSL